MKRRTILVVGGAGVVASAVGPLGLLGTSPAAADPGAGTGMTGTTLDATVVRGDDAGFRSIQAGPGEPFLQRNDFGLAVRQPTLVLATFAQMTDTHVVDDQSPMRTEWLDRYSQDDNDDTHDDEYPTRHSYRAHEMLSTHIVDAMVRAIRKAGRGPRTGMPLNFTIVTGDVSDNAQLNEVRWFIDLLDGRPITPNSGHPTIDQSYSTGGLGLDPQFWRPADKPHEIRENKLSVYYRAGFPEVRALPGAARRRFTTTGIGMPWYSAYGNHDGLVQGIIPPNAPGIGDDMREKAVGNVKPYLPAGFIPDDFTKLTTFGGVKDALNALLHLSGVVVTPDQSRRILDRREFIAEHRDTTGFPRGHGFDDGNDPPGFYEIPTPPESLVKYLVLDTVRTDRDAFGSKGGIDHRQMDWLRGRLDAYSTRSYVLNLSFDQDGNPVVLDPPYREVRRPGPDRLVVVFGHHNIGSITNTFNLDFWNQHFDGSELTAELLLHPNVIAYVNGHTHRNSIRSYQRGAHLPPGGFYEINTASHIDWPAQSRLVEVSANRDVISIHTTMVDIDAPLMHGGDTSTPPALASLARQLQANDVQGSIVGNTGTAGDRNTHLVLPAPFPLPVTLARGSSVALARNQNGRLELIGCNPDNQLFVRRQVSDNGPWGGWQLLDGATESVAAERNHEGRIEILATDPASRVSRRGQGGPDGGWPAGRAQFDNGELRTLAYAANHDGRMEFFGTNAQDQIYQRWQQLSPGGGWSAWTLIDGAATRVAVERAHAGHLHAFAIQPNGAVMVRWQQSPGSTWTGWSGFGGPVATSIALGRHGDGRLELFVTADDGLVWNRWQLSAEGNWSGWAPFGGRMTQLAAESNKAGELHLVGIDRDGDIWERISQRGGPWTAWQQVDGVLRPGTLRHTADLGPTGGTPPSLPPPPQPLRTIPNVVGARRTQAQAVLSAAGFPSTLTTGVTPDEVMHDCVLDSEPAGGASAPPGTPVELRIGRWNGNDL